VETYRDVGLGLLGDPTRRAIFELLARHPCSAGELAQRLPISRPAVSRHLRVLTDGGLVVPRAEHTRRVYRLNPDGVAALRAYWTASAARHPPPINRPLAQPHPSQRSTTARPGPGPVACRTSPVVAATPGAPTSAHRLVSRAGAFGNKAGAQRPPSSTTSTQPIRPTITSQTSQHYTEALPGGDVQVDAVQHELVAERLAQPDGPDGRLGSGGGHTQGETWMLDSPEGVAQVRRDSNIQLLSYSLVTPLAW
jgi:DNA-binding transcriptional ArsR family regulator